MRRARVDPDAPLIHHARGPPTRSRPIAQPSSPATAPVIALRGAGRTYGATVALHPTDLDFAVGDTTVLIGPSGCGKSTLLRLIVGLIEPTVGDVRLFDTPVTRQTAPALRRRMGYVIQAGGLFPHLTAGANAALMARHLGWSKAKRAERLTELAEQVHLPADLLERFPGELSGGQRQRVALMRALMLDPEVVLLDEPLGALDPMIRADLQVELKEVFQRLQKTVVMVTHDLAEAAWFADRIVLLRAGHIVQAGTLEDLTQRPADDFVTTFVNAQRSLHLEAS